jgi:hypothetical protein
VSKESSGGAKVTVVAPGSKDDPFTAGVGDEPEPVAPTETEPVTASEPDQPDLNDPETQRFLAAFKLAVNAEVDQLKPTLQRGWERQNATLRNELKELKGQVSAAEQRATTTLREAKLASPDLTDAEKELLKNQWSLEDREVKLNEKSDATDSYFASVVKLDLMREYEPFGLTEEILDACDSVDAMESAALKVKVQFLESGGKPPAPKGPAAASAGSDLGGSPPAPTGFKLSTEQSHQALRDNVKGLFSQPGQVR